MMSSGPLPSGMGANYSAFPDRSQNTYQVLSPHTHTSPPQMPPAAATVNHDEIQIASPNLPNRDPPATHDFVQKKTVRHHKCAVCKRLSCSLLYCEICELRCHERCKEQAAGCRPIGPNTTLAHHYAPVTLFWGKSCQRCNGWIGGAFPLACRCSRCGVIVHVRCADGGGVCEPWFNAYWPHASFPEILAIVNCASGGGQGALLKPKLRRILGKHQVFDIQETETALRSRERHGNSKVVVCGGDGSVGSTLETMDHLNLPVSLPVGIIPLGTGNDLARSLLWGGGYTGEAVLPLLQEVARGGIRKLDRWSVQVNEFGNQPTKRWTITNNFSWGVDPRISCVFNATREKHRKLFRSRTMNKIWYLYFFHSCSRGNPPVADFPLSVDGQSVRIPGDLEGLAVINITSYAGGANLWKNPGQNPQRLDDGMFEIAGFRGSGHLLGVALGSKSAVKLCQGRELTLTIPADRELHLERDGEGWLQRGPCTVTMSLLSKSDLIGNTDPVSVGCCA